MKKNFLTVAVLLTCMVVFSACGDSQDTVDDTEIDEQSEEAEDEPEISTEEIDADAALDFDASEYVTLGECTNLEVSYITPEVSDEDIASEASYLVEDNVTYETKDGEAEAGDQVTISYEGVIDGEAFDGGSDEDYSFILGDGEFLDEFEEPIYGAKAGDVVEATFNFPEDYSEDVAGKEVTFTITVSKVESVISPEYNDELVQSNTDYDTVEEYEESIREELMEEAQDSSDSQAGEDVLTEAIANAEFSGYPDDLLEACYSSTYSSYSYYAEMFGMDVEDFISSYVGDGDDEDPIMSLAQDWAKEIVFLKEYGAENDIDFDALYTEELDSYAEENGYDSGEAFEADYGKFDIYTNVMRENVIQKLLETATLNEVSSEDYYEE